MADGTRHLPQRPGQRNGPDVGASGPFRVVPPAGFEPAHPPPEGGALSPELRGPGAGEKLPVRRGRSLGGTQGAGSGVPPRAVSISTIVVTSALWVSAIERARVRTAGSAARSAAYCAMSKPPWW